MPTYKEKLLDPRWQKKRLEILQRDKFTCQQCGDNKSTLHVHHRRYIKGNEPWDYPTGILVTLCTNCHKTEQESMDKNLSNLQELLKDIFLSNQIFILSNCLVEILFQIESYNRNPQEIIESLHNLLSNDALVDQMILDYNEHKKIEKQNAKR